MLRRSNFRRDDVVFDRLWLELDDSILHLLSVNFFISQVDVLDLVVKVNIPLLKLSVDLFCRRFLFRFFELNSNCMDLNLAFPELLKEFFLLELFLRFLVNLLLNDRF